MLSNLEVVSFYKSIISANNRVGLFYNPDLFLQTFLAWEQNSHFLATVTFYEITAFLKNGPGVRCDIPKSIFIFIMKNINAANIN